MENDELTPLFIIGVWRSGTTLISRIMNNHPDLDVTYDTVHFMRFSYNKYNPISEFSNVRNLVLDINKRIKMRYNLKFDEKHVLDELKDNCKYSSVYDSIMRNFLLKKSGKKNWGEKTNLAWSKIPYFLEMFPKGMVIHIIRDPRAVLASWKKFTHAHGNDYLDSIINCYDSMQKSLEYTDQFLKHRYLFITYENLVTNPHDTIKKICKKLDIQYNNMMLDNSKFKSIFGDKWSSNSIYNEKLNGISNVMVNRWQTELEDWEILLTEIILNELLDEFHYSRSGIKKDVKLIDKAINEISKSELTSEGITRFLLTQKGFERYPSDPLIRKNWDKRVKTYD